MLSSTEQKKGAILATIGLLFLIVVAFMLSGNHFIRYRARSDVSSGGPETLTVQLYQGTGVAEVLVHDCGAVTLTTNFTTGPLCQITNPSLITNYADLNIRFTAQIQFFFNQILYRQSMTIPAPVSFYPIPLHSPVSRHYIL